MSARTFSTTDLSARPYEDDPYDEGNTYTHYSVMFRNPAGVGENLVGTIEPATYNESPLYVFSPVRNGVYPDWMLRQITSLVEQVNKEPMP